MWRGPTYAIGSPQVLVPATLAFADIYLATGETRREHLTPSQDSVLSVAHFAGNAIHRATVNERATDVKSLVLVTVDLPQRGKSVTRRVI
jgi:hypothetical protein